MRVSAVLLVSGLIWAQAQQPEVVSHEAPATFSSRVNLVSVPVVIRDDKGRAVGGLRQEDFQLFDKGRPQVISKFTVETTTATTTIIGAPPRQLEAEAAVPVPPPAKPELPERYVAYFFDDIHLNPGDLLQMRRAANRHLDRGFDSKTRAGVFTTSGRFTQDFTSDIEKLHAALDRIQPWTTLRDAGPGCPPASVMSYYVADTLIEKENSLGPGRVDLNSTLAREVYNITDDCLHHPKEPELVISTMWLTGSLALRYGEQETTTAFFTLGDLIRSMSVLLGSRTVVLSSPGFIVGNDQRLMENDIFEKAIRANVIINALDARGLYTPAGMQAEFGGVETNQTILQAKSTEALEAGNVLSEFAAATGGTLFHNDNGLQEGLQQLTERPEYVYVLGFSPDNLKSDGSYHGLKVKLKESAKLTIEARRGYWAPNHGVTPAEQAKEDIEDAVFSREEFRDIPIRLHTEFFKQAETKAELTVETRVDLKNLPFKKTDDRNRDTVVVVTGLFDQNGRYVNGVERTMDLRLRDQTLESARNSGLAVKESFDIPPGRYIVRVVVRDSEGRSMAAQNEGVEIP